MESFKSLEEIVERPESSLSEKHVLGRKMFEARNKTRELETQLKKIENRIKHLHQEQDKGSKNSKIVDTKQSNLTSVKEAHWKLKQDLVEWKVSTDQAIDAKRRELTRIRKQREASILGAKTEIQSKNRISSLKVKAQSKANHAFIQRYKETVSDIIRDQAQKMNKSNQFVKHSKKIENLHNLNENEKNYNVKLQNELQNHEKLIKMIESLTKTQESISQMMSQESKALYSNCAVLSERSPEKDENIPSIV
jgi:chromosome segregation ATPase